MTAPHTSSLPTQTSRTRLTLAVLTAWVPAMGIAMTGLAWRTRLPEVLPTHWGGFSPAPDQFAATSAMWGWTFGVAVLAGIGAVVAAYLHRRAPTETAFWLAFAGGGGGTFAAVWLTSATTTLAASSPADARPGWRLGWIVLGLAWAAVVYAVAGRVRPEPLDTDGTVDPVRLRAGERVVWAVTLQPRFLQVVLGFAGISVIGAAFATGPWAWPAAVVVLALTALFWRLQVIVDQRGLRVVAGGLFGLPLRRIRLADIEVAGQEHIEPIRWGGWGYRVFPSGSAIVTRSGPGLVLDLRSGRRFAVTVPDPATPAALLTALRHHVG